MILALDANFRLSNKMRSTTERDPNLTDGRAYVAPWDDYATHLLATNKELAETASLLSNAVYLIELTLFEL